MRIPLRASAGDRIHDFEWIKIREHRDVTNAAKPERNLGGGWDVLQRRGAFCEERPTGHPEMRALIKKTTLAIIAAFALASPLQAAEHRAAHNHAAIKGSAVLYAHGRALHGRARSGHFADLVGDPDSGVGFYPLPWVYRVGAWRAHQRQAYNSYSAVRFAIMSQAMYSYAFPYNDNRPSVYNPFDGYGTPFFAGYYGPGDLNAESGLFGRPYRN
jgi:hypothetical protein